MRYDLLKHLALGATGTSVQAQKLSAQIALQLAADVERATTFAVANETSMARAVAVLEATSQRSAAERRLFAAEPAKQLLTLAARLKTVTRCSSHRAPTRHVTLLCFDRWAQFIEWNVAAIEKFVKKRFKVIAPAASTAHVGGQRADGQTVCFALFCLHTALFQRQRRQSL